MRLAAPALVFMLATLAGAMPLQAGEPDLYGLGNIYCDASLTGDASALELFLSESLKAAIADAEAKNVEWIAAHPGKTSPLADGIKWQSGDPRPSKCIAWATMSALGEGVHWSTIDLIYSYADDPDASFRNVLKLEPEPSEDGNSPDRIIDVTLDYPNTLRSWLDGLFPD